MSQTHETPPLSVTRWFAKGIGLVWEKQTLTLEDGSRTERGLRLVRFSLE